MLCKIISVYCIGAWKYALDFKIEFLASYMNYKITVLRKNWLDTSFFFFKPVILKVCLSLLLKFVETHDTTPSER